MRSSDEVEVSASFREAAGNVDFIILVNECMKDPHSYTAGIFFE